MTNRSFQIDDDTPEAEGLAADQVGERAGFVRVDVRQLSAKQFGQLGVSQIAYVRPVVVNGTSAFAIHAADGTPMAVAGDRDMAIAAIHQHEMLAALVH